MGQGHMQRVCSVKGAHPNRRKGGWGWQTLGVYATNISRCCRKPGNQTGGYEFRKVEEEAEEHDDAE